MQPITIQLSTDQAAIQQAGYAQCGTGTIIDVENRSRQSTQEDTSLVVAAGCMELQVKGRHNGFVQNAQRVWIPTLSLGVKSKARIRQRTNK
jgi:hypothetical protein